MEINSLVRILPRTARRHKVVQLLSRQNPIQKITFNDNTPLYVDLEDAGVRQVVISGECEPDFFALTKPFIARGGTFFDAGANQGFCSFGTLSQIPVGVRAAFHLFEANHKLCGLLTRSKEELYASHDVNINCGCVTNSPGTSLLEVTHGESGHSHISSNKDDSSGSKTSVEVPNIVLDDYIAERNIKKIQFFKIDIEGWEPFALQGARKSLNAGLIEVVYMEVSTTLLARAGFTVDECLNLLLESGFDLYWCKDSDLEKRPKSVLEVNGYEVPVAPFDGFPSSYQTDLLAIHKTSEIKLKSR